MIMPIIMPRSMPMVASRRRNTYQPPARKKTPEPVAQPAAVLTAQQLEKLAQADARAAEARKNNRRMDVLRNYTRGLMTNAELFAAFTADPGLHLYILKVLG